MKTKVVKAIFWKTASLIRLHFSFIILNLISRPLIKMKIFEKQFLVLKKNVLLSCSLQVILGQNFSEKSEYEKFQLNGLPREHPPASVIFKSASVGVNIWFTLEIESGPFKERHSWIAFRRLRASLHHLLGQRMPWGMFPPERDPVWSWTWGPAISGLNLGSQKILNCN